MPDGVEASARATSVEQLLKAVDQLAPAERRELQRRLAENYGVNESSEPDEMSLKEASEARLPSADERCLKRLITKCDRDLLTDSEFVEYQKLAQQAQQIEAGRVWARAELARRQRKSGATSVAKGGRG